MLGVGVRCRTARAPPAAPWEKQPSRAARPAPCQPLAWNTFKPKLSAFSHEVTRATGIAPGRGTGEPAG